MVFSTYHRGDPLHRYLWGLLETWTAYTIKVPAKGRKKDAKPWAVQFWGPIEMGNSLSNILMGFFLTVWPPTTYKWAEADG